jgi:signal peptidase I
VLRKAGWTRALGIGATIALLGVSVIVVAIGLAVRTGRLDLEPVLSGSMRPTFQPGDLVASWRVPVASLRVGDVIAFVPPGKSYREEHRIVRLTRSRPAGADSVLTTVTTRGDANHGLTDPWGRITLRGTSAYRLVAIIPKLGWASQLRRGIVLPLLLVGAGLLFVLSAVASLSRELPGIGRRRAANHQRPEGAQSA